MKRLRWTLSVLCYVGLLAACSEKAPDGQLRIATDDPAVLATGQAVYAQHCAACHGAKREGQPRWRERDASGRLPAPPHDASGHTWHHPDQVLFDITKHGVAKAAKLPGYESAMPAYAGVLSDAEIVAVLAWIRSTWPPDIRRQQEEVNAQALRNAATR
ncbi:cytochrome c [Ramlibacter sp. USB13]|uniref:Cytochrome c n=1 Tax=Ramlibacter cellulosilyticus TaxID=2764187 RepID=A0A923MSZ1_9BURK|nr:cytochrome c [Ramlibacter cellulosilyticus]MBC5784431.1 cytochrome c [Ramlibacter cellulosilyticus]